MPIKRLKVYDPQFGTYRSDVLILTDGRVCVATITEGVDGHGDYFENIKPNLNVDGSLQFIPNARLYAGGK